jgi:hypothetical protein
VDGTTTDEETTETTDVCLTFSSFPVSSVCLVLDSNFQPTDPPTPFLPVTDAAPPPPRRDNRYEDRPYVPGGSRGGDYGAPPSRGGDPYGGRPPRRETEIYATPAAG